MKSLFVVPVLALGLSGCAVYPPQYAGRPANPYEWQTVSVTQVAPGTGARAGVGYSNEPVYVQPQPVYVPQPVYAPAPEYWFPPVSIGLDFIFSNHRHHGGYRGRRR